MYRGSGLSFDHPEDWTVATFGKNPTGNLSIRSRDAYIFLAWARDPGVEPEKILNQIEKTYNGDEIKILSSMRNQMRINGENASILDIYYSMGKYGSRKRFVVWNSSVSDRLFFATISSSSESYNSSISAFNHMLETFSDVPDRKATKLKQRSVKSDAWGIVLEDLLASYSYKDTSTLLSRKVHLETIHSLMPLNGTYRLSSMDKIEVDLPVAAAVRAAAVQDMLTQKGYETKLIQKGGNIRVAVKDNSDSWQLVSLNPREPGMMIGVPIDSGEKGIVYGDISELAEDNLMDLNGSINSNRQSSQIIRTECDPSRYAELKKPSSENKSWDENLQKVLDSYDYGKSYRESVFDCSNTSQVCWSILEGKGYDARLMMSYKGHPLDPHMWVAVRYPYEKERYVAVEATNTDKNKKLIHVGIITMRDDYYKGIMYNTSAQFSWLHPEEGIWLVGD
ncbi:MAG: hypothetical protein ACE14P_11920 [Methanotrichaceae archaeon]